MIKRHKNAVLNLLDVVALQGYAIVSKPLFAKWYGNEKFTKAIRDDFREKWDEVYDEKGEINFAEVNGASTILITQSNTFWEEGE